MPVKGNSEITTVISDCIHHFESREQKSHMPVKGRIEITLVISICIHPSSNLE